MTPTRLYFLLNGTPKWFQNGFDFVLGVISFPFIMLLLILEYLFEYISKISEEPDDKDITKK